MGRMERTSTEPRSLLTIPSFAHGPSRDRPLRPSEFAGYAEVYPAPGARVEDHLLVVFVQQVLDGEGNRQAILERLDGFGIEQGVTPDPTGNGHVPGVSHRRGDIHVSAAGSVKQGFQAVSGLVLRCQGASQFDRVSGRGCAEGRNKRPILRFVLGVQVGIAKPPMALGKLPPQLQLQALQVGFAGPCSSCCSGSLLQRGCFPSARSEPQS